MNEERTIEIDVLLELRDLLRANYWFLFKKLRFFFIILFVVCVFVAAPYILGIRPKNSNDNYWGLLIPFAVTVVLIGSTYFSSKRQLASNKSLNGRIHYSFSDNGIDATGQTSFSHTNWSNIYEAYETKQNFLIFISQNMMYTIPKRCFRDSNQISTFKEILRSELATKAKLK